MNSTNGKPVSLLERLLDIVLRRDFEFAEFQGGLLEVLWAAWLAQPYYDAPSYPIFRVLVQTMSNQWWAMLFGVVGLGQLWGLFTYRHAWRRAFAFMAMLLWTFTTFLLAIADWHILSVPLTASLALGSAWGFIRIGLQRKA